MIIFIKKRMYNKRILLEAIYSKTGIYISTKNDCRIISQLIADEKIGYLSESTLYRFFLYENEQTKPYKNTLSILAMFCGFKNWDSFYNYYNSNYLFNEPEFLNHSINVVLKNLIHKEKFSPLIEIFNSLEDENYKTKEFYGLKAFLNFQNTNLFPSFIKKFGDNPFVRTILIEALYDPNHRIEGYAESLELYLNSANKQSESYEQDAVFANAVLFRYYYLNKDLKALEIGARLYDKGRVDVSDAAIHVFPKTRFIAYKLWYLSMKKTSKKQLLEYQDFILNWIQKELEKAVTVFEISIIYQTIIEAVQQLKLTEFEHQITQLTEQKLTQLNKGKIDLLKLNNANGLLNFLPA
jgi:hypothetical protein